MLGVGRDAAEPTPVAPCTSSLTHARDKTAYPSTATRAQITSSGPSDVRGDGERSQGGGRVQRSSARTLSPIIEQTREQRRALRVGHQPPRSTSARLRAVLVGMLREADGR
jgi:hypothetical protein